jgi:hypothetical protein
MATKTRFVEWNPDTHQAALIECTFKDGEVVARKTIEVRRCRFESRAISWANDHDADGCYAV